MIRLELLLLGLFLPLCANECLRTKKNLVLIDVLDQDLVDKAYSTSWRRYMHKYPDNFACWFVKSHPNSTWNSLEKDVLWLKKNSQKKTHTSFCKLLDALEVFSRYLDAYDYVIYSSHSSFLVFPDLLEFLSKLPLQKIVAKDLEPYPHQEKNPPFSMGECTILSIDLARLLLKNKTSLMEVASENPFWENWAFTQFLDAQNISITRIPFYGFEGRFHRPLRVLKQIHEGIFFFRVKVEGDAVFRYRSEKIIHQELFQITYEGLLEPDRV